MTRTEDKLLWEGRETGLIKPPWSQGGIPASFLEVQLPNPMLALFPPGNFTISLGLP